MKIDTIGDMQFARLPEQLTLANAAKVRAALLAPANRSGARIVLDLSRVQLADSSGLGALLACIRTATATGGRVVLMAPTMRVRALIELTRLDDVAPLADDGNDAAALFATAASA